MNNAIKVTTKPELTSILLPSSETITLYYLTISCIYNGPIIIQNYYQSFLMKKYIDQLIKIGLEITFSDDSLIIHNSFPLCEKNLPENNILLVPPDNIQYIYLLFSLLSRGKKQYQVVIENQNIRSDIAAHKDELSIHKLQIDIPDSLMSPIGLQGPCYFRHSLIEFPKNFDENLLAALCLSYCDGPLQFTIKDSAPSEKFELVLNSIKIFYFEKVRKNFQFYIPVDFHLAQYYIAMGMSYEGLIIHNCQIIDLMQKETNFLKIITKLGGSYNLSLNGLHISKPDQYYSYSLPYSEVKDFFTLLIYIASQQAFSLTLEDFELKNKNIDLTNNFLNLLDQIGIAFEYSSDQALYIHRQEKFRVKRKEITLYDHYDSIMMTYLFLRSQEGGSIKFNETESNTYQSLEKVLDTINFMDSEMEI